MTGEKAIEWLHVIRTGFICDPQECGLDKGGDPCRAFHCREQHDALVYAIECIEKCIELGSCKECKSADFCYDSPDVCFCLQHDHTMYADDTCNYFYRDGSDNE